MISNHDSPPEDDPALREALKRCSPATYHAACQFRKFGHSEDLRTVVLGVVERFVERELRPKLLHGSDTLRLSEDLGIDSLTMMEIVMVAEEVLHVSVSNEELTNLRTLGEVQAFVRTKAAGPSDPNTAGKPADDLSWDFAAMTEEVRRLEAEAARSIIQPLNGNPAAHTPRSPLHGST